MQSVRRASRIHESALFNSTALGRCSFSCIALGLSSGQISATQTAVTAGVRSNCCVIPLGSSDPAFPNGHADQASDKSATRMSTGSRMSRSGGVRGTAWSEVRHKGTDASRFPRRTRRVSGGSQEGEPVSDDTNPCDSEGRSNDPTGRRLSDVRESRQKGVD